ncbi:MAG: hypothetical protein OZSIB_3208 [Candidatus Ozemobacter sibiricus]|uniref:Uncharacterized protein n=1 Tax=Candidatus Ozemobacter sibiricus TaxID=2268124 RepID=A0A367ZSW4_9BACT|nr:MAG: hypothetical protein OZSIB_3208 [Candidatus Ozemobacter sibiricus]
MVGRITRLIVLGLFVVMVLGRAAPVLAQEPPFPPGDPEMDDEGGPPMGPGGPHMGPPPMGPMGGPGGPGGPGRPGGPAMERLRQLRGGRDFDPKEMEAHRERQRKNQILRTRAEAHKNLADLYASQNKIEQAVAELHKILELASQVDDKELHRLGKQIGHVYMEIAELYLKADQIDKAKSNLQEGADRLKGTQPEIAARLYLNLGDILRKKGAESEAENAYKKAIDITSGAIDKAPAKK